MTASIPSIITRTLIPALHIALLPIFASAQNQPHMNDSIISGIRPLGFRWEVQDPFLFCAHHRDHYPRGNDSLGPAASLAGRNLGEDFTLKDGFRMYHGETVPGFPEHPHRGFETVTIVLEGWVDHSDSHGQAGRYGPGDVQWMTAGSGLQHSEMFPLLDRDRDNPLELFQVWLNLPAAKKMVSPHYKMLWSEQIPVVTTKDDRCRMTIVRVIAGRYHGARALSPAPDSYAADPGSQVAIWMISMDPEARWILPEADPSAHRTLYFHRGDSLEAAGVKIAGGHSFDVKPGVEIEILNGSSPASLLLLQGKPLAEPVAQYGPFVMNTEEEIRQAFADYRSTQFGGWPWPVRENVFPRDIGRFARYIGGTEERP